MTPGRERVRRGNRRGLVLVVLFVSLMLGLHRLPAHWFVEAPSSTPGIAGDLVLPGVANVHRLTPRIIAGAQPEDDEGFRALAAIGVRTIISVDGPPPDIERGRRAGLRYVHLPVLYSGITRTRALEIARAVRDLPGPVFIHCHRGTQRSPTAAALAAMIVDGMSKDDALASMKHAGTSDHYAGLYSCVQDFEPASAADLEKAAATFPEVQAPLPFVEVMGELDAGLDRLKAGKAREDPAHEALLLRENLFELTRRPSSSPREHDAQFQTFLHEAIEVASELEAALRQSPTAMDRLERLERACTACHERFRDRP